MVLLINGFPLISKIKIANSFFETSFGLMFSKKESFDYAYIFSFSHESQIESSVTMIFCFYPIDVIFLNREKQVVDKAKLNPWVINYTPKKPAQYVIELPLNLSDSINIGDQVTF